MSHHEIRSNKICQNCGHFVKEKFCPNCGQMNTETRQPFLHLIRHFIEDFTHYDGQFWTTFHYLFTKPGKLTKVYLSGKRQQFVPPVKLYIFVSFVTFTILAILPSTSTNQTTNTTVPLPNNVATQPNDITLNFRNNSNQVTSLSANNNLNINGAKNLKQYDSIYKNNSSISYKISRPFIVKIFELKEKKYSTDQIIQEAGKKLGSLFPKALFIYLPIFAFILWVIHNKKKYWFFDHGIFTLHYFSFLLLTSLLLGLSTRLENWMPDWPLIPTLLTCVNVALVMYGFMYFFIAHRHVYNSSTKRSFISGVFVFSVNLITFFFVMIALFGISLMLLH